MAKNFYAPLSSFEKKSKSPASIMSKPAIFCQEIGFTLSPKAPMLSKIILVMSCPTKTIKNILISPILGASKIVPKTKNAPKTPPKNFL